MQFFYFERLADGDCPAGVTVSKHEPLPDGEFGLDEYIWPLATLWFVAEDDFSADERGDAYAGVTTKAEMWKLAR